MAAKLTPCRILASLVNTLSPPHAPVHLVAPLASLAPLAPPHSHFSRLGSHQHTRLAGRVAVEAQRLHAGVCAQRVGELRRARPASPGSAVGAKGGAFRQFSSEQRRGWRDRTIGCQ